MKFLKRIGKALLHFKLKILYLSFPDRKYLDAIDIIKEFVGSMIEHILDGKYPTSGICYQFNELESAYEDHPAIDEIKEKLDDLIFMARRLEYPKQAHRSCAYFVPVHTFEHESSDTMAKAAYGKLPRYDLSGAYGRTRFRILCVIYGELGGKLDLLSKLYCMKSEHVDWAKPRSGGICTTFSMDDRRFLQTVFATWQKHSGDLTFPVPPNDAGIYPNDAYETARKSASMFDVSTSYGRDRAELLDWCISTIHEARKIENQLLQ